MKQLLIGIGSPYGDDQLGWMIIDELSQQTQLCEHLTLYKSKGSGTDWYTLLPGHERLVFFDALISLKPPGSIINIKSNELDQAFAQRRHSTHGISLSESISLADTLGLLTIPVQVFGVSVGTCPSNNQLSDILLCCIPSIVDDLAETIKLSSSAVET